MKNYLTLRIISIICFVLTGVSAMIAIFCALEYKAVTETIVTAIMTAIFFVFGVIYTNHVNKEFEKYVIIRRELRKSYDQLSKLYKKHYWILDVDHLIPTFTNKKQLLIWCADTATACHVYQGDYKLNNICLNRELSQMISLAKEIIDHKQYL